MSHDEYVYTYSYQEIAGSVPDPLPAEAGHETKVHIIVQNNCCTYINVYMLFFRHTVTSPSFGSFDLVLNITCDCECSSEGVSPLNYSSLRNHF